MSSFCRKLHAVTAKYIICLTFYTKLSAANVLGTFQSLHVLLLMINDFCLLNSYSIFSGWVSVSS